MHCVVALCFLYIYIPHGHGNRGKIYHIYKLKEGSSRLDRDIHSYSYSFIHIRTGIKKLLIVRCDSGTVFQGIYMQSMHAYKMIELARHACMYVHELAHECQMHNYIYSARTIGEMLMIACMQ